MIYKRYGLKFRELREQHNFSLSDFKETGISKATISKFERGDTMMSFDKVVTLLQEMGVTLEEFEQIINNYSSDEKDLLLYEVENAYLINNIDELSDLSTKAQEYGFHFLSIAIKCCYMKPTEVEIECLTEHLYDITAWSYSDLSILYFAMNYLNNRDIFHILEIFLENGHDLFNSVKASNYFVQTCCRAVTVLSDRQYKKYAKYILDRLDFFNLIKTMYHRNLQHITYGYWLYCFDNREEGIKVMRTAIEVFELASTPEVSNFYKRRYNDLVQKNYYQIS